MIESPNSRPGKHEHLFHRSDLDAAAARLLCWDPAPTWCACEVCGELIDVTPGVAASMARERIVEADLPPVRGWGTWRRGR